MNDSDNYKKLLKALSECSDNSDDPLIIKSSDLDADVLNINNINFENQAEGIYIDLSSQHLNIYKNKQDAITYIDKNYKDKIILVIDENLIYTPNTENNYFFINLFFAIKLKNLFLSSEIVSYHDVANKNYIFLSELIGKIEVGYKNKLLDFCNGNYSVTYEVLRKKFKENEYLSFFRDNFIKVAKEYTNPSNRFFLSLTKIDNIFENSNREFELYKNKFSFEKFQSSLEEEKEKYIKKTQESLFEFQSKVNSLPVQFGVYLFLIIRFKEDFLPLIAVIVLITVWSIFSLYLLNIMNKGISYTKIKLSIIFEEISLQSGIDISSDKQELDKRIIDIQKGVKWFKYITIIFSVILILFSCLYVSNTLDKNKPKALSTPQNVLDKAQPLKGKIKVAPSTDSISKKVINNPPMALSTKVTEKK